MCMMASEFNSLLLILPIVDVREVLSVSSLIMNANNRIVNQCSFFAIIIRGCPKLRDLLQERAEEELSVQGLWHATLCIVETDDVCVRACVRAYVSIVAPSLLVYHAACVPNLNDVTLNSPRTYISNNKKREMA